MLKSIPLKRILFDGYAIIVALSILQYGFSLAANPYPVSIGILALTPFLFWISKKSDRISSLFLSGTYVLIGFGYIFNFNGQLAYMQRNMQEHYYAIWLTEAYQDHYTLLLTETYAVIVAGIVGLLLSLVLFWFQKGQPAHKQNNLELWFFAIVGVLIGEILDDLHSHWEIRYLWINIVILAVVLLVLVFSTIKQNNKTVVVVCNVFVLAAGCAMVYFLWPYTTTFKGDVEGIVLAALGLVCFLLDLIPSFTFRQVVEGMREPAATGSQRPKNFDAVRHGSTGQDEILDGVAPRTVAQVNQKLTVFTVKNMDGYEEVKEEIGQYGWAIVEFESKSRCEVWVEGKKLPNDFPTPVEANAAIGKILSGETPHNLRFYHPPEKGK